MEKWNKENLRFFIPTWVLNHTLSIDLLGPIVEFVAYTYKMNFVLNLLFIEKLCETPQRQQTFHAHNNPKNLQLQPKITLHSFLIENCSNYNNPNSNNPKSEDNLSEIETGSLTEKQIDTILFNKLTLNWFLSLRESSRSINTRRSSILYRSF